MPFQRGLVLKIANCANRVISRRLAFADSNKTFLCAKIYSLEAGEGFRGGKRRSNSEGASSENVSRDCNPGIEVRAVYSINSSGEEEASDRNKAASNNKRQKARIVICISPSISMSSLIIILISITP